MVNVDQVLDPRWPIMEVTVIKHLHALEGVDDASNRVANDKDDDDDEEHHGDAVVPPLIRRYGVVSARRLRDRPINQTV